VNNPEIKDAAEGIAIIGMTGRFPGAKNIEEFWQNLRDGVESIAFFTDEELKSAGVDDRTLSDPKYVKARARLEDAGWFDAPFFGYSSREAEVMDPQHRLFLEGAWEALENAGYTSAKYEGVIGVYAGTSVNHYLWSNVLKNPNIIETLGGFQTLISNDKDYLTTRVSYKMNLRGPSIDVQTACSTSLVAICLACQGLQTYQVDMALAGGISVGEARKVGYIYQEGGILSPDGSCRAFDAQAQGTVTGSGMGIVVLKRLEDAITDGDFIYAVIKGAAINNDGSAKIGYTAPSANGQAEVIAAAQSIAGVLPQMITYVETHGTGTALGDPIEVEGLRFAFGTLPDAKKFCALGSVKTNIGHLDAAAGVAGLIKTVLSLINKELPPSLHFKQPSPKINFSNSPFYVNTSLSAWNTDKLPRRAGVSSFGIGGTNAHMILEEAPITDTVETHRPVSLLLLSTKTPSALETATTNLARHLKRHPDLSPADVAYTLQIGRKDFMYRRMLVCRSLEDAVVALENLSPQLVYTASLENSNRSLVFLFPGGGTQYENMGIELYRVEPTFRAHIDTCAELLKKHIGLDLRELFYTDGRGSQGSHQLDRPSVALPALFITEYSLAKLWMEWGIHPRAMIGHSLGEYVAACLAEVISLEDALSLVALRGQLFEQIPEGGMLSVPLSQEGVQRFLSGKLSLAAINAPALCVVSGPLQALDEMEYSLTKEGLDFRRLHISVAAHSEMLTPILGTFAQFMEKLSLQAPKIPFISNISGTWITSAQATDPNYWTQHLRQTVRFADGWLLSINGTKNHAKEFALIMRLRDDKMAGRMPISILPAK